MLFFYANQLFMLITNLIFNKLFFGTLVLVSDSQVDHASKPDIHFFKKGFKFNLNLFTWKIIIIICLFFFGEDTKKEKAFCLDFRI